MSSIGPISTQAIDPNAMRQGLGNTQATRQQKIEKAGVQFEAIMVRQFLSDALKTDIKGALNEEGGGNDTYQYFVTDTLAQSLAQQGVFGIGKQITQQLLAKEATLLPAGAAPSSLAATSTAAPALATTGTPGAIKAKHINL